MDYIPVRMIATAPLNYNERGYAIGEEFDADPRHAKLLKLVRKADLVADQIEAAAKQQPAKKQPKKPAQKRGYNRRDMRASAA